MSTGADAKTMAITPEYADGHERIFGERERPTGERRVWVMRCRACDGVEHAPEAKLYQCPKCNQWLYGSVDASIAPPPPQEARNAPILCDRYMEGVQATDGTDIGSRRKRREYMRAHGLADADDYKNQWKKQAEQRERVKRGERGALPSKTRRDAIGRALYRIDKP